MHKTTAETQPERPPALPPQGFVRLPTILHMIPVGRSTLWEMIARGNFPPPVKLSARVSAWRSEDVLAFMASRGSHAAISAKAIVAPRS